MERDDLAAWLRLTLTPGVGNEGARKLLAAFGLPQAIFAQSLQALTQVVSAARAGAIKTEPPELEAQLETTLNWLGHPDARQEGRRVLVLGDAAYPAALLAIEDPPLMLYVMGTAGPVGEPSRPGIAIVGSRNPTPQGEVNARQFAKALSASGLTVVSGMALGVDGAAHQGALEGAAGQTGPATIAVVGTGLDRVYPKKHLELAHRIVQDGLIISEFPLGTPPLAANFPKRNRIISALSLGTLVVEAAVKSGSLITARMALEQGKEVFAIPGSIHSPQSRGCHALIRQGAKLVESAQDVLEELQLPPATPATAAHQEPPDTDEPSLLKTMGFDPVSLDALIARTGISTAGLQVQLLELELAGQVARLPGGLFQRMALS
jgi:DNA processing protein